jgi:hypothetical protein
MFGKSWIKEKLRQRRYNSPLETLKRDYERTVQKVEALEILLNLDGANERNNSIFGSFSYYIGPPKHSITIFGKKIEAVKDTEWTVKTKPVKSKK